MMLLSALLFAMVDSRLSQHLTSPPPRIVLTADVAARRPLFDWSEQHCRDERIIPDAPARAFRRADGQITLIAPHFINWAMTGRDFESLEPGCDVIFGPDDTPGDQHAWIEATYTQDGRHVAALLSRELSTDGRPVNCTPAPGKRCWLGDIVAARSTDGGRKFALGRTVATLGDRMPENSPSRFGAFTTSNIARGKGGYFMIAFLEGQGVIRGNCLLRSDDPMDPVKWRAWDGRAFTVDLSRPDQAAKCAVLQHLDDPVRSIGWVPSRERWIAVLATRERKAGRPTPVQGFFASESSDLRDWGEPRLIVEAAISPRQMGWNSYWNYPVLIDPKSKSRNFETLDHDDALLLFTEHHLRNNSGTMNRDLVAMPVRIGRTSP